MQILEHEWKCTICGYRSWEGPLETCPFCQSKCTFIDQTTDYRVNPECC